MADSTIRFKASFKGATCDEHGQWTVRLLVPSADSLRVAQLTALTELVLDVTISPDEATTESRGRL